MKQDTDTKLDYINVRLSKLESAKSEAKISFLEIKMSEMEAKMKKLFESRQNSFTQIWDEIQEMKNPWLFLSAKRKIETPSLEIADETEQGMQAIKDSFAEGNSDNDEDETKNSCNMWDKKFKSFNFLKIHDTKYHIKHGSQNIYKCDNCKKTFSDIIQIQDHIKIKKCCM